jgi:hypothetical protein
MRVQLFVPAAALACLMSLPALAVAQSAPGQSNANATAGSPTSSAAVKALVGTWRSQADPIRLTTEFERSVWGNDASSLRMTELVVQSSGEATLRVTRKVVDARGQDVPASTTVEEARLVLGPPTPGLATRMEHDVKIVSAERRYPDDPASTWPLDGLGVKVVTFTDGDGNSLEVRFDTPEGRGSFWETLERVGASTARRAQTAAR